MVEFTGERVIPGEVNDDLWNEHVARYAFARLYAKDKRVLDAGCGTGYGSAELALAAASVTALDVDPEAIAYCRANFPAANIRTLAASCTTLPFRANAFDLIAAFEVIEHLRDYRTFLDECARVLTHQGLFVVSSPNKRYYAESRATSGANPYHEHEFEPDEFTSELERVFSNVRLLVENRAESIAFHSPKMIWPAEARIDGGGGKAEEAHFLIGLCSFGPLPEPRAFVYVPKAANLLREREQHIQLLNEELQRTKTWLTETQGERDQLLSLHRALKNELEARNRWADELDTQLKATGQRVVKLQEELASLAAGYEAKLGELEAENRAKTAWALETEARLAEELTARGKELAECVRLLDAAEATVVERTEWAQRLEKERNELEARLQMVRASRWVTLGRSMGLGPHT